MQTNDKIIGEDRSAMTTFRGETEYQQVTCRFTISCYYWYNSLNTVLLINYLIKLGTTQFHDIAEVEFVSVHLEFLYMYITTAAKFSSWEIRDFLQKANNYFHE